MTLGFRVDFHFMRASEKQLVEAILATWIFEQDPSQIERLAADGKVLRGTGRTDGKPLALLSLVTHQLRTTLRSVRIAEKATQSPPPAIRLLRTGMGLQGCTVTADAMHCQQETARFITRIQCGTSARASFR
jgi:hypothetical protein